MKIYIELGRLQLATPTWQSLRHYSHAPACLQIWRSSSSLLEPLRHLQESPGQFLVRRGGKVARMTLRLPISTVIGDNLSSNKLVCGKVENKTITSVRMSRRCLTSHDSSDECPHRCHPVHPQLSWVHQRRTTNGNAFFRCMCKTKPITVVCYLDRLSWSWRSCAVFITS